MNEFLFLFVFGEWMYECLNDGCHNLENNEFKIHIYQIRLQYVDLSNIPNFKRKLNFILTLKFELKFVL